MLPCSTLVPVRFFAVAFALVVAGGCVHHAPEAVAPPAAPTPHLPAPVADLYIHHFGRPLDALVVQALAGRPWEEVLSGAATSLALLLTAHGEVDLSGARWAAIRAGYPFPVLGLEVVHSAHDLLPALSLAPQGDIGMVRARGPDDDIWVVLHGAGGPDLPAVPREAQMGDFVPLAGGSWRAATPDGAVRDLGKGVVFDRTGEWLLQAWSGAAVVATLPVYVGERTPEKSPFLGSLTGATPDDATFNAVASVWSWYGHESPVRDSAMDSVARVRLREYAAGTASRPAEAMLHRAGFMDGVAAAECQAESLRACLEQMWWSPEQRGIFTGDYTAVGVATSNDGSGVRVVVLAAR